MKCSIDVRLLYYHESQFGNTGITRMRVWIPLDVENYRAVGSKLRPVLLHANGSFELDLKQMASR